MIYVIPGHGWKAHDRYDPGAMVGSTEEAVSVRRIADAMLAVAPPLPPVLVDGEGWYHQRHTRMEKAAREARRVAVVHLHHDASKSGAKHAMAMHDRRSKGGAALARHLAAELMTVGAPWGPDVREVPVYDDRRAAGENAWLYRAYGCIDEVYDAPAHVSACLLELGFLTHDKTRVWLASGGHTAALAEAILRGAASWLER